MKVSVQFPLQTVSENHYRSAGFAVAMMPKGKQIGAAHAMANATAKQRRDVRLFLDSQLPKLRKRFATGPNFFRVTIVRICAGALDEGNLWGALKGVQDEVAAWLGVDDGDRSAASWKVVQQKCPPKVHAVRVEIEDEDPDTREVHRVVGPLIQNLGLIVGDCSHCGRPPGTPLTGSEQHAVRRKARKADARKQTALVFRRAFYVLEEDRAGDEENLHEVFDLGWNPPLTMTLKRGRVTHVLHRSLCIAPELGEIWVYEAPASSPRAATERRTGS